ncbi:MAG TPA: CAP domain-containing protein, partial [Candidatus Bathyarchaeia archaeon]|nr:CAP domain-containing protein [Candidatus Bathyarchaeia archaeon]
MSSKSKTKIFSLVFVAALVAGSAHLFASVNATIASDITAEKVIELTNQSRKTAGETTLSENPKLSSAAEAKAEDMIDNNYFSHTSPTGTTPWDWFQKVGYDYNYAGENLAMDFHSADNMEEAWMASPTHRANILNEKYTEIGTAVKEGIISGHETTLAVVMFASGDRDISSAADAKKEIAASEEPVFSGAAEKKSENAFPALPIGEEKKNAAAFAQQPIITSPQSGET